MSANNIGNGNALPSVSGNDEPDSTIPSAALSTHRYPKRNRKKVQGFGALAVAAAVTATTARKKKKPNTLAATKVNNDGRPEDKYTDTQWKQFYGDNRCVFMKDVELTEDVLKGMSQPKLKAVSVSRSIRLATNPKVFRDGKAITGNYSQRMVKNISMYLTHPENAARGSNKAGLSDLRKAAFKDGKVPGLKSSVDESILHKIANLGLNVLYAGIIWADEYLDSEGDLCTALTIKQSSDEEINASGGDNASKVICNAIQMQFDFETSDCATDNTKATYKLRYFMTTLCNMKMDERCKSAKGKNQFTSAGDRGFGWENGGMKFYFKGSVSDITLKQTRVEPAEPQS